MINPSAEVFTVGHEELFAARAREFHQFGHVMHHILAGQQQWAGIGGFTYLEGDIREVPSQMLEEWMRRPQVLRNGLLSPAECELLLTLKCEGFAAKELAEAHGVPGGNGRFLHRRLQTVIDRLSQAAQSGKLSKIGRTKREARVNFTHPKKIFKKLP